MSDALNLSAVSEFMWREADLLDRRQYEEWLDLWTDDGLYIVPIQREAEDYADVLNYAYDDAKMRKMRVVRLMSRFSMSAASASITIRTTSRFVLESQTGAVITVRAAQHLADYRRDRMALVAADIEATIRQTPDGLKYEKKIVRLANSEDAVSGFAYLL